ncbi:hypothetical protein A4H97_23885 [Niastella yeongjuensis]|uniref:GIY-YIG domain-containing protein n=1 Tax=Niastella yeongjuensis TaxID=354355 RepID=A0A1V9F2Y5_9BACT|nr:DNA/RNA helicase domain-containing protein [Niastella yeongjuensis]OQP52750.1 hypothetical protein A4H97_23885 [Niastella yeongjuensis]SEP18884.1 hypothetical protein SAMN05660816_04664 [Niastella yeongjuensis]
MDVICDIQKYSFDKHVNKVFHNNDFAQSLWPVIYLLRDNKEMYIGETTDVYTRMEAHLKNEKKSKLTTLHLITSDKFNKSATLDIEHNLIKYIAGDGIFELLNANIGLANHNYFQKNGLYWDIFKDIWSKLKNEGIVNNSLEDISNSNLFKYSPYKSLNPDQSKSLIRIMKSLLDDGIKTTLIEGGAGTGKTVLAIFLFKLLNTDFTDVNLKEFGDDETAFVETLYELKKRFPPNLKMALVVPMASFRETLKKVFRNVKGLSAKMVVGPTEIADETYDVIVVEEAHRLRRRENLGSYFRDFGKISTRLGFDESTNTELDWVIKQGKKVILFYDEFQSIKPSDLDSADFEKLKRQSSTCLEHLKSQLRVKGGKDYVDYIHKLMNCLINPNEQKFESKKYSFVLFDSLSDMVDDIKRKNDKKGLSRLVAGYSWPWISKKNNSLYDINVDNVPLRWNSTIKDWINSSNAINEVGCIHTSQGYDLNYAGIIFGREISYDEEKNEIVILKNNYYDRNAKAGIVDPNKLKKYIINIYTTILQRGIHGTSVYACDPALRKYLSRHIHMAKVPDKVHLTNSDSHDVGQQTLLTNSVPLFDLMAAAGGFSSNQIVTEPKEWIKLPDDIRATKNMFACKVVGESMNKKIPSGSTCLFRIDEGGTRQGKIVLVQHTSIQDKDFGNGFTVKEYRSKKYIDGEGWHHASITLNPLSYNSSYQPIIIEPDELNELKVIGVFERVLYTSDSENL